MPSFIRCRFLGNAFKGLKKMMGVASADHVLGREYSDIAQSYSVLLDKELGSGQFGVTRLAVSKHTGQKYACKTINKSTLKVIVRGGQGGG